MKNDYEAQSYPEEKSNGGYDNKSTSSKIATYAIKLADLNTTSPASSLLSPTPTLKLDTSAASPTSTSSSPMPPPSSPYLSLLQTDLIDINPNTNLMRSFDHAKNIVVAANGAMTAANASVINPAYRRGNNNEASSNIFNFSPKGDQSSIHSIETFVASVSSSREDMMRQFHNNVQQINVFVKEPKEIKELRTKTLRDSKYCQTDQVNY